MGIDPGLTGAVATIKLDPPTIMVINDIPVLAGQTKKHICPYMLSSIIRRHTRALGPYHISLFVLEDVHSMPNQGVASMFKFGRTKGVIEGVLAGLSHKITLISPQSWKKQLALTKDKNASRAMATKIFGTNEYWQRVKDDGRAEAALIALAKGWRDEK
jgi:crossover junction endodeoxyribonuclease RuvC